MFKKFITAMIMSVALLLPFNSEAKTTIPAYHPPECSAAIVGARAYDRDNVLVVYHVTCDHAFRLYYESVIGMPVPKQEIARSDGPVKDINVSVVMPTTVLLSYRLVIDGEKVF